MSSQVNVSQSSNAFPKESWLSWVVCLTAGLLFLYEFIQMNMFNAISPGFMATFQIDPEKMGQIDSFYFIANVIFLIPAGYLLDRYSIRRVILISMLVCVAGTALIALTHDLFLAMLFRFLTGIGSAFCFLSCIRLATNWFHPKRMGLVVGVIVTEAMLGGVLSQAPLELLVKHVNWRSALLFDAALGILIWGAIFFVVRDFPVGFSRDRKAEFAACETVTSYARGFRKAFLTLPNWFMGVYTALMNAPMVILGGIWGISYLSARFGITDVEASTITSTLFFGMMLGSPLAGYISDVFSKRWLAMLGGALLLIAVLVVFLTLDSWGIPALLLIFFLIGVFAGTQVISYPVVAERSPAPIVAMSVSVVNISAMSGSGILKPLFGYFMHEHQIATHRDHLPLVASDFHFVMWLLPALVVVGLLSMLAGSMRRSAK